MAQAVNNTTPDQLITIDNALTLDQIAEIASKTATMRLSVCGT